MPHVAEYHSAQTSADPIKQRRASQSSSIPAHNMASSPVVTKIISLLAICAPEEYGAVQDYIARPSSIPAHMAASLRVPEIIRLLGACTPDEYGAVQHYMTSHPPVVVEKPTLESSSSSPLGQAAAGEHDASAEDGESPMLEVQIVSIAGDVFTLPVSRDDTVRNQCWQQQQDMNCCVLQGAALQQHAKVAMGADGRVELFFEGNPVSAGQ